MSYRSRHYKGLPAFPPSLGGKTIWRYNFFSSFFLHFEYDPYNAGRRYVFVRRLMFFYNNEEILYVEKFLLSSTPLH